MEFIQSVIYRVLWGVSDGVKSDLRKIGDNLQFITPIGVLLYGAFTGELKLLQVFILYYLGCTVIQVFLKWLVNNPRPNEIDTTVNPALTLDWSVNKGDSFPSGHTMSAVSGGIFWFNICGYMGILGLVLGVFTAFTRLVVKAHWMRDVVTSGIIAIIMWGITDHYYLNGIGIQHLMELFQR